MPCQSPHELYGQSCIIKCIVGYIEKVYSECKCIECIEYIKSRVATVKKQDIELTEQDFKTYLLAGLGKILS